MGNCDKIQCTFIEISRQTHGNDTRRTSMTYVVDDPDKVYILCRVQSNSLAVPAKYFFCSTITFSISVLFEQLHSLCSSLNTIFGLQNIGLHISDLNKSDVIA